MRRHIACHLMAFGLAFAASAAQAATIQVSTVASSGVIGSTTVPTPVAITAEGDGSTVGIQLRVLYDTAVFDAVRVPGVGNCSVNDGTGTIIVAYLDPSFAPLPAAATSYCNVTFSLATNVTPPASFVLDAQTTMAGEGCIDSVGNPVMPCTLVDGAINVVQPTAPTITYAPTFDADGTPDATAELTIPQGALGSTQSAGIVPTANGGLLNASVALSCQAQPPFSIASGANQVLTTGDAAAPIVVQATVGISAQQATVTCVETDTPGGAQRTRLWDVVVPAGEQVPEFASTPPSGGTIAIASTTGASATGSLVIRNTGAGPLQVACQLTGDPAITQGVLASPVPAGGTATLSLACVVPATAASAALICTTNDADELVATYVITCGPASVAAIPATSRELLAWMPLLIALLALPFLRHARHR